MREHLREGFWAAVGALVFLLLFATAASCQPIRFVGPSPSPAQTLAVCCVAGAFILCALLQIPLALRDRRRHDEEQREKQRILGERVRQAQAAEPKAPASAAALAKDFTS
jgi:hypothetical protein